MSLATDVRQLIHDVAEQKIQVTDREDGYADVHIHELADFEIPHIQSALEDGGYHSYPVTKGGQTGKLIVGVNR